MDPKETLLMMLAAIASNAHQEAKEAASDLAIWISKNGFLPKLDAEFFQTLYRRLTVDKSRDEWVQAVDLACLQLVFDDPRKFRENVQPLEKAITLEGYAFQDVSPEDVAALAAIAEREYGDDEHEFDADPAVSVADGGTWVQGWFWVSDEDEPADEEAE